MEALDRARESFPELEKEKLSYAGRLDPLAQGVMLVLSGEANKNRDVHLNHDKTYYFDVLFGLKSDSFDPLGIVKKGRLPKKNLEESLRKITIEWEGERTEVYPPYSSKTVDGKPLFYWARQGIPVSLPSRKIFIYEFNFLQTLRVPLPSVVKVAKDKIRRVGGDFRQSEVLESWSVIENSYPEGATLPLVRFKIKASTGTYVRSLADRLGRECDSSAMAFHIVRTDVGPFGFEHTLL